MHHLLVLFLAGLFLAAPAGAQSAADRWMAHLEILADDSMEGRSTGTPGYEAAADYVIDVFRQLGVKPAAEADYEQPVPLIEQYVRQSASSLSLVHDSGVTKLAVGEQILPGSRVQQIPEGFEAPLVFIGHGLHLPEVGHDDFAGIDLGGKIAVVLSGGPSRITGPLKSHASSSLIWDALAKSGALGVITITDPKRVEIPWDRMMLLARASGMRLADASLNDAQQPFFTARFSPEEGELLFRHSAHRFADILALARDDRELPRFDLEQKLKGHVVAYERTFSASNIIGRIEGRDSRLKHEHVVLTAHLDHLGIGPPVDGDRIYNGAMDNAAGVASLLETARTLMDKRPKRSILLIALTAEERGLLGSWYFSNRPTIATQSMVANVNMDMYLPLWPLSHITALGADESTLGPLSARIADSLGIRQVPDRSPERNLFVRSDQYSFVRVGIPALAPMFAATTDAQKTIERNWLQERYHAPSDDLAQPINPKHAAAFNRYLAKLILRIADQPERPQWHDSSYFKRFADSKNEAD